MGILNLLLHQQKLAFNQEKQMFVVAQFKDSFGKLIDLNPLDDGKNILPDQSGRRTFSSLSKIPRDTPLLARVTHVTNSTRFVHVVGTMHDIVGKVLDQPDTCAKLGLDWQKTICLAWPGGLQITLTVDASRTATIEKVITRTAKSADPCISWIRTTRQGEQLRKLNWPIDQSKQLQSLFDEYHQKTPAKPRDHREASKIIRETLNNPPMQLLELIRRTKENWVPLLATRAEFGPLGGCCLDDIRQTIRSISNADIDVSTGWKDRIEGLALKARVTTHDRIVWNKTYPCYAMDVKNPDFWLHACQYMGHRMGSSVRPCTDRIQRNQVNFALSINEKLLSFWFPAEKLEKDHGPGYTPDQP